MLSKKMSSRENLNKMNLSFAGCGFLCIYHAGVCAAIKEYAPQLTQNKILGASAGAIAAAGLICNMCISKAMSIILSIVKQARAGSLRALSPMFDIIKQLRGGLEKILPENAHILCTGRLFISLTRARDYQNVVVSEYESRDELIQALICSSFIPFYCGRYPPKFKGEEYIDGGLSNNQPFLDKHSVSVSPFSGESDICPSDLDSASILGVSFFGTSIQFTTQNLYRLVVCLFPPPTEICSEICRRGFLDAIRFLRNRGLAPCDRCLIASSKALFTASEGGEIKKNTEILTSISTMNRVKTAPNLDMLSKTYNVGRFEECDRCLEQFEVGHYQSGHYPEIALPAVVQKTLDEALAGESKFLKYLRSFRAYRWTIRLFTPVIFPMEVMIYSFNRMKTFLENCSKSECFYGPIKKIFDFILFQFKNNSMFLNSYLYDALKYNSLNQNLMKLNMSILNLNDITKDNTTNSFNTELPNKFNNVQNKEKNKIDNSLQNLENNSFNSQNENYFNDEILANNFMEAGGEDSGLSLTEDSSLLPTNVVKKRDVGCSPIRHVAYQTHSQRLNNSNFQKNRLSIISDTSSNSEGSNVDNDNCSTKSLVFWRHTTNGSRRSLHSKKSLGSGISADSLTNENELNIVKPKKKKMNSKNEDKKQFLTTRRRK